MPRTDRFLDIRRDPHSAELLARGGDSEAHSVLQRAGFIAVVRVHETYHRAPAGLAVLLVLRQARGRAVVGVGGAVVGHEARPLKHAVGFRIATAAKHFLGVRVAADGQGAVGQRQGKGFS